MNLRGNIENTDIIHEYLLLVIGDKNTIFLNSSGAVPLAGCGKTLVLSPYLE
jgi:hypothetical protein